MSTSAMQGGHNDAEAMDGRVMQGPTVLSAVTRQQFKPISSHPPRTDEKFSRHF